jgi:cobyrinic acid a,c-diamide synthase
MARAIVIAGTHSGVGKTTITVGLVAALRRAGFAVQPFKVGPDYIDATYHTLASGRWCRNLDTWMMDPERVQSLFSHATRAIDFAVIEGVMGLYDGQGYEDEQGSTAQVAKLVQAPVVVVIDVSRMARSAAAVATGVQGFDPAVPVAGFIVNRAGSDSHGRGVASAISRATGLPVLGWLPRDSRLHLPERHLGLVPAAEASSRHEFIQAAEDAVGRYLDVSLLQQLARETSKGSGPWIVPAKSVNGRPIIAVARDEAFHFTYEENLQLLQEAGADVTFFSPLHDSSLPAETAGLILSGGFPEIFAAALAANTAMLDAIRRAHRHQLPIYAECGGLMYLTEAIIDQDDREHAMVGLLPGRSVMSKRLTLGYRQARAARESWLFHSGETVRGHEFHYSCWHERPRHLPPAYWLLPPAAAEPCPEGACLDNLVASYVHLHFWGKPELATRFVTACGRQTSVTRSCTMEASVP